MRGLEGDPNHLTQHPYFTVEETGPEWTYVSSSMGAGISKGCEAQRKGQDHLSRAELGEEKGQMVLHV